VKKFVVLVPLLLIWSHLYSYDVEDSIETLPIKSKPYFSYLFSKIHNYSSSTYFLSLPDGIYAYGLNFYYLYNKDCFGLNASYLSINGDFLSSSGYYNNLHEEKLSFVYSRVFGNSNSLNNLVSYVKVNFADSFLIFSSVYKINFDIGTVYFDSLPMVNSEKRYNFYLGTSVKNLGFTLDGNGVKNEGSRIMVFSGYGFIDFSDWYAKLLTSVEYDNLLMRFVLGIELDYLSCLTFSVRYDLLNSKMSFCNSLVVVLGRYYLNLYSTFGISELGNEFLFFVKFDF